MTGAVRGSYGPVIKARKTPREPLPDGSVRPGGLPNDGRRIDAGRRIGRRRRVAEETLGRGAGRMIPRQRPDLAGHVTGQAIRLSGRDRVGGQWRLLLRQAMAQPANRPAAVRHVRGERRLGAVAIETRGVLQLAVRP